MLPEQDNIAVFVMLDIMFWMPEEVFEEMVGIRRASTGSDQRSEGLCFLAQMPEVLHFLGWKRLGSSNGR